MALGTGTNGGAHERASFSDIPAPLNYLTINYDSINQKFSSINVAQTNSCAHNDLSVIIRCHPIAFMLKMLKSSRRTEKAEQRPLAWHKAIKLFIWKLLLSLLRAARREAPKSLINSSVKTKQPSQVNFKPAIISLPSFRLINKMGRRRYQVSKCRHKHGSVRGFRLMELTLSASQFATALLLTALDILFIWLTSMASEFTGGLCKLLQFHSRNTVEKLFLRRRSNFRFLMDIGIVD